MKSVKKKNKYIEILQLVYQSLKYGNVLNITDFASIKETFKMLFLNVFRN